MAIEPDVFQCARSRTAGDLEKIVIQQLHGFLTDRKSIIDAFGNERTSGYGPIIERASELSKTINGKDSARIKSIVRALVHEVRILPDQIAIDLTLPRLNALLTSSAINLATDAASPSNTPEDLLTLTAPIRLQRLGHEIKLLIDDPATSAHVDISLVRLVARAHDIQTRLNQDTTRTVHDVAREEGIGAPYLYMLLRLVWLAPDIVTAIVNGRQPLALNAKKLMRLAPQLPADWAKQRIFLGFH